MERVKSRKTHNWNQIHYVVTTKLGYISFSGYRVGYVYYQRPGSITISLKKSNSISKELTQKIMLLFSISYNDFICLHKSRHS